MEEVFTSLLAASFNPGVHSIDRSQHIDQGWSDSIYNQGWPDNVYWVHIVDQPEWKTHLIREIRPEMPEGFNNVLSYYKDLGLVNVKYQWN